MGLAKYCTERDTIFQISDSSVQDGFFRIEFAIFIGNLILLKIINDEFFSDCRTNENDVYFNITQDDKCNNKTSLLTGIFTTGACSYLVSAIIGGIIMGQFIKIRVAWPGLVGRTLYVRRPPPSAF